MHPKHVLVVGATGFIGQALVKRLLASGHRVSALHRNRKPEGLEEAAWIGTGNGPTARYAISRPATPRAARSQQDAAPDLGRFPGRPAAFTNSWTNCILRSAWYESANG